jgi:D-lactate dehydrogenase
MKVVAYNVKTFEKAALADSNQKKHDTTFISNPLGGETVAYAAGRDAVIVSPNDDVSAPIVNKLADKGIRYVTTHSVGMDHIVAYAAAKKNIEIANVPDYSPQAIAEHTVTLALSLNRHVIQANLHSHLFDFKLDGLMGFNLYGKTVGLIGLGNIGRAAAAIFNGFGCRVIGHDIVAHKNLEKIEQVSLDELLHQSDIISFHLPLTPDTKYMISAKTIDLMKNGVMLINTARGELIYTKDVLKGLESGKIGYLGLDVYEYEKSLFYADHEHDQHKDPLFAKLMGYENVLDTPLQAFLTTEALQKIALQTIRNLDMWQQENSLAGTTSAVKDRGAAKRSAPAKKNLKAVLQEKDFN